MSDSSRRADSDIDPAAIAQTGETTRENTESTMEGGLTRRQLLWMAAGATAINNGGLLKDGQSSDDETMQSSVSNIFEQFQKAESAENLETPQEFPAIALTQAGWFEWPEDADSWQPIPLGTEETPHQSAHFQSVSAEQQNNVRIAAPGEVQDAIDAVTGTSENPGVVRLKPEVEYAPSSTWRIQQDVILECNGAKIVPDNDIDLFHIFPTAQVIEPVVDLTDFEFTSAVFTFDPAFAGNYFGDGTTVSGGRTMANQGTGTLFSFQVSGSGHIALVEVDHALERAEDANTVETAIEMHNEGNGFINGNVIRGMYRAPQNGIQHRGPGLINTNSYHLHLQPRQAGSERGWFMETGSGNMFVGTMWDPGKWDDAAWRLAPGAGNGNVLVTPGRVVREYVVDESDSDNNRTIIPSAMRADELGVAFGKNTTVEAADGIAIGNEASAMDRESIAIGRGARVPLGAPRAGQIHVDGLAFGARRGTWPKSDLSESEITFEIDEENDQLDVVAKYRDGSTIKQGSIDLDTID